MNSTFFTIHNWTKQRFYARSRESEQALANFTDNRSTGHRSARQWTKETVAGSQDRFTDVQHDERMQSGIPRNNRAVRCARTRPSKTIVRRDAKNQGAAPHIKRVQTCMQMSSAICHSRALPRQTRAIERRRQLRAATASSTNTKKFTVWPTLLLHWAAHAERFFLS